MTVTPTLGGELALDNALALASALVLVFDLTKLVARLKSVMS